VRGPHVEGLLLPAHRRVLHLHAGTAARSWCACGAVRVRRSAWPARTVRRAHVFARVCFAQLVLLSVLPAAVRNPLKHVISKLDLPYAGQIGAAIGIALLAALVDSYLKAQKHTHPVTDGWKDKMEHSNKRLRAERNIYISAGCMFAFVVMCQLWALIKRVTDLEYASQQKDTNHNLLKKQIESNEKFKKEMAKDDKSLDAKSAEELRSQVKMLKDQNEMLQEQLEDKLAATAVNDSSSSSAGLRSRPAAKKAE
jgi:hypothetical protein